MFSKKKKKEEKHRSVLMLALAYLMPDCWLEVSSHPGGLATGHLDQGFHGFPGSQSKC
jgi:hypothetical protein